MARSALDELYGLLFAGETIDSGPPPPEVLPGFSNTSEFDYLLWVGISSFENRLDWYTNSLIRDSTRAFTEYDSAFDTWKEEVGQSRLTRNYQGWINRLIELAPLVYRELEERPRSAKKTTLLIHVGAVAVRLSWKRTE